MTEQRCKTCNRKLVWARTAEGKLIPLDVVAPVYTLIEVNGRREAVRTTLHFVSHFATCPDADYHSRKKETSHVQQPIES